MRQLDNYEQFFDNDKNFLVGSLVFCKKGTSTQETIYSWDSENEQYVPINPVQFISIDGRPNTQIFLSDVDYTIYVNKYIGNGDMQTDTDPNNWAFQYSFNNLYDVISLQWTNDVGLGLFVFENLQDMKTTIAVDMYSDSMVVALAGWTTKGDKPITHYYWDANCSETATDVEFVKPQWVTGNGRWVLINEFAQGFDVRNAGCFPTATSAGDIEQTYALQRANAYCVKYGLKMVIPHTLGSQASCYKISNLIMTARTYVMDGVRLYTPDSATLGFLTEDNVGRNYPFIMRDDSNTGTWSITADLVQTSWFGNQATNKENWRPNITALTRLVYNRKFDTTYNSANAPFSFSNIIVDFTTNNFESFELTECVVRPYAKVLNPCLFTRCDMCENVFDSSITYAQFALMGFDRCKSDFGNWSDPNKFVIYKAIQQEPTLDLQGQWCAINLTDYGLAYCFQNIDNAIIDYLEMPSHSGTFDQMLFMHNVKCGDLLIGQNNTQLTDWSCDDCDITIDDSSHALVNCSVKFMNSRFSSDNGSLQVQGGVIRECFTDLQLKVGTSATICDCNLGSNVVCSASSGDTQFGIVFNGNTLSEGVQLVFWLNGQSNCLLFDCSFVNNVCVGTKRELIFVDSDGGSWTNLSNFMRYTYRDNVNVSRSDSFKGLVGIPYYKSNDTIPAGVDIYLQQDSGNACRLYGCKIDDYIFSFGEPCKKNVLARFETERISSTDWFIGSVASDNTATLIDGSECATSNPVVYSKDSPQNRLLFNNSGGGYYVYVKDSAQTGDTIYGILSVEYLD